MLPEGLRWSPPAARDAVRRDRAAARHARCRRRSPPRRARWSDAALGYQQHPPHHAVHRCARRYLFEAIRDNVNTRLKKSSRPCPGGGRARRCDRAPACAGLGARRLRRFHLARAARLLVCVPVPGQGAVGVERRADAPGRSSLVASLDHAAMRAEVGRERIAVEILEGGCQGADRRARPASADGTLERHAAVDVELDGDEAPGQAFGTDGRPAGAGPEGGSSAVGGRRRGAGSAPSGGGSEERHEVWGRHPVWHRRHRGAGVRWPARSRPRRRTTVGGISRKAPRTRSSTRPSCIPATRTPCRPR